MGDDVTRFCSMQECSAEGTRTYEGPASLGQRVRVCEQHYEYLTGPPRMPNLGANVDSDWELELADDDLEDE